MSSFKGAVFEFETKSLKWRSGEKYRRQIFEIFGFLN
tara:strand:+ start:556 stop:666 length:111 start_codon:yes stop_codon:yes gene_type:complete